VAHIWPTLLAATADYRSQREKKALTLGRPIFVVTSRFERIQPIAFDSRWRYKKNFLRGDEDRRLRLCEVYAPGANGDVAPIRSIGGSNAELVR
jgi:hypothetical protein